jgi:hypothetical protein
MQFNDTPCYHGSSGLYFVRCKCCGAESGKRGSEEAAADAWNERFSSWGLLMEILDEHYPADIFGGEGNASRDIGPQIVTKLREIDILRKSV